MKNTDTKKVKSGSANAAEKKSENRTRIECFTLIETLLKKYRGREKEVSATIDELCARGVPKGCFQDYAMLSDVLTLLGAFESAVKAGEGNV